MHTDRINIFWIPVCAGLNAVVHAAVKRSDVTEKLLVLGTEVRTTTPREAQDFLASEVARWTKVIRDENIPPQE